MAAHVREQNTVAAFAAVTGLTTTGAHVYRDRDTEANPLQETELPGLTVDDDGEPAELITMDSAEILERRMGLRIAGHVKASSGYGALLNQMLKEIEIGLAAVSFPGGRAAILTQVGAREKSQASDKPTVRQAFNFEITYYTAAGAPDVAL